MKITTEGPSLPGALQQSLAKAMKDISASMKEAADAASKAILDRGRADISGAGRFGARWTEGLTSTIEEEPPSKVTITVREAVPYWTVFQYGKVIHGKPLLYFKPDRPIFYRGKTTMPAVISVRSVTIPKKFHLVEICHDVAGQLGQLYRVSAGR